MIESIYFSYLFSSELTVHGVLLCFQWGVPNICGSYMGIFSSFILRKRQCNVIGVLKGGFSG